MGPELRTVKRGSEYSRSFTGRKDILRDPISFGGNAATEDSTALGCPVSAAVFKTHGTEMAVMLFAALRALQLPTPSSTGRIASGHRNIPAAGTRNEKDFQSVPRYGLNRLWRYQGLGHMN